MSEYTDGTWIAIVAVANIPLYLLVGRVFFGNWENFFEAIWFWFKPDMWSWIDGELGRDWYAEALLGVFVAICAGAVFGEFWLLKTYVL